MIFSTGPIISVGTIGKPHGFDGRLKFHLTSNDVPDIKEPVFIPMDGKPVPFFLSECSGAGNVIIQLEGITTYDEALQFTGKELFINGSDEADEDLVLTGYTIHDLNLGELGTVTDQQDLGAQWVLTFNHQGNDHMVPFVDAIIKDINHETRQIQTDLPDGLLDL